MRLRAAVIILPVLFLFTCGKDYRESIKGPEELFFKERYLDAARMLLPQVNKKGKDQLLYMMEAGYMLQLAEKYEDSKKVLMKAAEKAKVTPISISQQAAALMTNQRMTNYRGEDFEKVLVHMYLGIDFLMLKEWESAAIEFKAVNNELMKIKSENGEARYKQNIMAKYLAAIAHEIKAEKEDSAESREENREWATVEYRQILKLNPGLGMAQRDMNMLQRKNINTGELVVIFQAGRGPVKESRGKLLEEPRMSGMVNVSLNSSSLAAGVSVASVLATIKLADNPIPKFITRSNLTKNVVIDVGGRSTASTMLENIEYTAVKNFEDDYPKLAGKVAASVVLKAVTAAGAGIAAKLAADKLSGNKSIGSLVGLFAGLGTGTALFATMKPDLRCWHTLPANLQLARIRLTPGKYTASIKYIGYDGSIQKQTERTVDIQARDKVFLNLRTLE